MKIVAISALAALVLFVASAFSASAQDVLPEENLLVVACNHVTALATVEDVDIINCRQASPIEADGNRARVHVRVRASTGVFKFVFFYERTLWSNQGFMAEQ